MKRFVLIASAIAVAALLGGCEASIPGLSVGVGEPYGPEYGYGHYGYGYRHYGYGYGGYEHARYYHSAGVIHMRPAMHGGPHH